MASPLEHEIREHLRRYVDGRISLREFDAWFVPATREVDRTGPPEAIDLTYEVFLRLAEYTNGDWTESELKEILRRVASPVPCRSRLVGPGICFAELLAFFPRAP